MYLRSKIAGEHGYDGMIVYLDNHYQAVQSLNSWESLYLLAYSRSVQYVQCTVEIGKTRRKKRSRMSVGLGF